MISSHYIVTAAHCVSARTLPNNWRLTTVRLGEWNRDTNPDCEVDVHGVRDCAPVHLDIAVEGVVPHPSYNPNKNQQLHDIALVRLHRSIAFTDFVRPICLPFSEHLRTMSYDDVPLDVAGWGRTESRAASSIKLKATVQGVNFDNCSRIYSRKNIILQDTQLCAGGKEGIDSCRGDSGGPLVSLDTSDRYIFQLIIYFSFSSISLK